MMVAMGLGNAEDWDFGPFHASVRDLCDGRVRSVLRRHHDEDVLAECERRLFNGAAALWDKVGVDPTIEPIIDIPGMERVDAPAVGLRHGDHGYAFRVKLECERAGRVVSGKTQQLRELGWLLVVSVTFDDRRVHLAFVPDFSPPKR